MDPEKLRSFTPKMETYKQRRVELRVPDIEMVHRWKETAKKSKMSLSKFIVTHVENSLGFEEEDGKLSRGALVMEIKALRDKVKNLKEDQQNKRDVIKAQKNLIANLQEDNPFFSEEDIDTIAIRLFINRILEEKFVRSKDLFSIINMEPTDIKKIKFINFQLDNLENCGILDKVGDGWKWKL